MNSNNGIIIYRSRSEQMVDQMIWENPEMFAPVLSFMFIAFISIIMYVQAQKFIRQKFGWRSKWQKAAWPIGIALGIPLGLGLQKLLGWLILAI